MGVGGFCVIFGVFVNFVCFNGSVVAFCVLYGSVVDFVIFYRVGVMLLWLVWDLFCGLCLWCVRFPVCVTDCGGPVWADL